MTIRETTIAKLQQLPESLLQEVNDFIDFVAQKHQSRTSNSQPQTAASEVWERWFEAIDLLDIAPAESTSEYQQLLLNKYRHQGLEL